MLFKIDEWLIKWTQWFVRQCELYVNVTKKQIHAGVLFAMVLVGTALCLISSFALIQPADYFLVICQILMIVGHYIVYVQHKRMNRAMKDEEAILPVEIVTRGFNRRTYITTLLLLLLVELPSYFFDVPKMSNHLWYIDMILVINFISIVSYTIIEYVVCTVSLPPRERERKRYMREQLSFR